MAVLATADDVITLMQDTTLDEGYVNSVLITSDLILTKVYEYNNTVTDQLLIELQKYLAAHLIASTTKRIAETEKIGDAQISYVGKFGEGLKLTTYGQMLLMIDHTGLIARTGMRSANISAIKSFK